MEGQQRRHELFELAPPMDPPAGGTQSPAGAINRLRPVNLPGLSAGLAAISANYGGLFDDDSQQQHPFMGGGQFKSATFSTSSHQSASSSSSSSNNADSDGGAVHSLVAPLMAAAFRRPPADAIAHSQHHSSQHYHFPQSCPPPPLAYSPYATNGSQPSDPCTPTMGIGCLSNPAPAQSPYAVVGGGAFSPFSAAATPSLDQLGVNPFFWPWPPLFGGNGGGDIIGYTTSAADPHHQLLLNPHSAYNHLLSPQVDLYSAANSSSTPHQQHHFLPDHLIVDGAIVHHQHPSPTKSTTSVKANSSSGGVVVQPKCQGNKVGATKTAQMPRGQPRKGGRRPRETEQAEHMNDEDKERRAKRRERNKQAAARCRRRREERMQTLEEQVAQLQAENAEKERRIQQLAADRDRLMEALGEGNGQTNRNCRNHQQGQQQIMPAGSRGGSSSSTTTTSSGAAANSIGRILAPPAMNTRRRQLLHVPPFKLEPQPHQSTTTTMVDPLSSPGTPPNGRFANRRGGGADGSMLVNGTDPVISESAESQLLFEPKRAKFEPMVSNSRTENGGGDGANANNRPSPTTNNNRPNSLQLDLLYKEGYVANTPSKELATFGQGSGGGGGLGSLSGLFGTPGNELITPGMSQLTELGAHYGGVLMAQQTGLTPCQIGPVPVLMQPQEERPPSGQLSELR